MGASSKLGSTSSGSEKKNEEIMRSVKTSDPLRGFRVDVSSLGRVLKATTLARTMLVMKSNLPESSVRGWLPVKIPKSPNHRLPSDLRVPSEKNGKTTHKRYHPILIQSIEPLDLENGVGCDLSGFLQKWPPGTLFALVSCSQGALKKSRYSNLWIPAAG